MSAEDRRAPGINRVPLATTVEICGQDRAVPAFEASAIEVSGRGMRVSTTFLPELGSNLVLRFEEDGEEVTIEGEGAWLREEDEGGELGIRFTALDTGSLKTLKRLCSAQRNSIPPSFEDMDQKVAWEAGTAIRLHISGLAAPMKAKMRREGVSSLSIGSSLEFLKIGRPLEVENIAQGERRELSIETVSISVDPGTDVPQLVVTLRDPNALERTPQPVMVVDEESRLSDYALSEREEYAAQDGALAQTIDAFAEKAGQAALNARSFLKRLGAASGAAAQRMGEAAQGGVAKFKAERAQSDDAEKEMKRTRSHDSIRNRAAQVGAAQQLRSQRTTASSGSSVAPKGGGALEGLSSKEKLKRRAIVFGAPTLTALLLWTALKPNSSPPQAELDIASPGVFLSPPEGDEEVMAGAQAPQAEGSEAAAELDVPLYGKRQMATLEPAPLAAPESGGNDGVDEYAMVKDQAFDDMPVLSASKPAIDAPHEESPSPQAALQGDSAPTGETSFRVGKLELPLKYRMKLSSPAKELQGTKTATGFSIFLPGVKLLDDGAYIQSKDKSVAQVSVQNSARGARVTLRFKGGIPGYKARIQGDYVEFFINQ